MQVLLNLCIGTESPELDDEGVLLQQGQDLGELVDCVSHGQGLTFLVDLQCLQGWIPLQEAEPEVVAVLALGDILELDQCLHQFVFGSRGLKLPDSGHQLLRENPENLDSTWQGAVLWFGQVPLFGGLHHFQHDAPWTGAQKKAFLVHGQSSQSVRVSKRESSQGVHYVA